jgi:hypothetical protein
MSSFSYSMSSPVFSLDLVERTPSSIASALKKLDTEGKDLAPVRTALDEIEKARKEREQTKELQEAVVRAKQSTKKDRRFLIAFNYRGVNVTSGIEYGDTSVHVNSTFSTPGLMDDNHEDIDDLKRKLSRAGITHHIEYID